MLVRHGLNRLGHLDRATRTLIRRIEMSQPGELVHVDIKKLGRIPRAALPPGSTCNHHRHDTAVGGAINIRVSNPAGHYT